MKRLSLGILALAATLTAAAGPSPFQDVNVPELSPDARRAKGTF